MMKVFTILLISAHSALSRQQHHSHRPHRPSGGYQRPSGGYGGQGGGQGGLGNLLDGVQLNLLDAKLIGLGYVREDLVKQLCHTATQQLIREGVNRVRRESGSLVSNLTGLVDQRCSQLVNEGNRLCTDVMGQINSRFNLLTDEVTIEVKRQCDSTKVAAADMVKSAAKRTFDGQLELGRQLAEAEFMRQVAEQKVRGERMFQEEVEKGRQEADQELRRRVREGRALAETNFTRLLAEGRDEAERQYQNRIQEERDKGEKIFQDTVAEERAKAEKVFQETVDSEKAKAEIEFKKRVTDGQIEGEKMCTEMITVACQNVTLGSASDEFCEEFFFFTAPLDDEDFRRLKRQDDHLYGSFYKKVSQSHHQRQGQGHHNHRQG